MQFTVAQKPEFVDGNWKIVGRCTSTLHVGDRIVEYFPYIVVRSQDDSEIHSKYGAPKPINLLVKKIIAYRRELETLDSGMTGMIEVSGDASAINSDTILRG